MKRRFYSRTFVFFLSLCSTQTYADLTASDRVLLAPSSHGLTTVAHPSSSILPPLHFLIGASSMVSTQVVDAHPTTYQLFRGNSPLINSDVFIALGLFSNYQLGVDFSFLFDHPEQPSSASLLQSQNGLTEITVDGKIRFLHLPGELPLGMAFHHSMNIPVIDSGGPRLGSRFPVFNFGFSSDLQWHAFQLAASAGYRIRQPQRPTAPEPYVLDDQLTAGAALRYFSRAVNTSFSAEFLTITPIKRPFSHRYETPHELLLGWNTLLPKDLALFGGVVLGLTESIGSAAYRVLFGITYQFSPYPEQFSRATYQRNILDAALQNSESQINGELFYELPGDLVYFQFNSEELADTEQTLLDRVATTLKEHKRIKSITVIGHTDGIGVESSNMELGLKRAESVKKHLMKRGLPEAIISCESRGESEPLKSDDTLEGRLANRRVVLKVTFTPAG